MGCRNYIKACIKPYIKPWTLFFLVSLSFIASRGAWGSTDVLTQIDAAFRKSQIKSVDYDLSFQFEKNKDSFDGITKIRVTLNFLDHPLRIDAKLSTIKQVVVNGQIVTDYVLSTGFFEIPTKYLQPQNEILIEYANQFSKKSTGLQKFVDPVDHFEYFFTDSEPYKAHSFFPCFDQPDLKAWFTVKQTTPSDWVAISNGPIASETLLSSGAKLTQFQPTTVPIATYLLFVGTGNYKSWSSKNTSVPITIYARQSLAKYVDVDNIFDATEKGLAFFNSYFEHPYPFQKYAYVFSPELAPGAMENPGAVTMNENMIFRGVPKDLDVDGRLNTILHEMAHMWFGDLVTLKWWNDLWLNESFATFMAFVAQDQAFGMGRRAWQSFSAMENGSYWQDQLSTTHPIVGEAPDTDMAQSNFDAITYGKGASALKQLRFFIGEENFKRGLSQYFKKYAGKNTTLEDFLNEMSSGSGTDLRNWATGWLMSAGLNRVTPQWNCEQGQIRSFTIEQEPTASGLYLPHRTKVALFYSDPKSTAKPSAFSVLEVAYEGPQTMVPQLIGQNCPAFVYTNYENQDYGIHYLDPVSLKNIPALFFQVDHPFTRQMLFAGLYQMVRDQKWRVGDFFQLSRKVLQNETDPTVLSLLLSARGAVQKLFWTILTVQQRNEIGAWMEPLAWEKIQKENSPESYYMWLDFYIQLARSPIAQENLNNLMLTKTDLEQSRRWNIIKALSRMKTPEIFTLIQSERQRDPSSFGEVEAFAAEVAFPAVEQKRMAWKALSNPDLNISMAKRKAGGPLFHQADHPELSELFIEPFFQFMQTADWSQVWFMKGAFASLFPSLLCSNEFLVKSQDFLNRATLPPVGKRAWLEANEELEKCVKIRRYNGFYNGLIQ